MKALITALERRTLKTKLLLGFVVLMSLAFAIGIDALIGQRNLGNEIRQMYEKELLGVAAIKDVQVNYNQMARITRQYLLAPDTAERERALKQLTDTESSLKKNIEEVRQRLISDKARGMLAKFEENFAIYRRNIDRMLALVKQDKQAEAISYVGSLDFQRPGIASNTHLEELVIFKENAAAEAVRNGQKHANYEEKTTLILLIGGSLLSLLFGMLIAASIRQPTNRIRSVVEQLSKGKLDEVVPHTDYPNEIGDLARSIAVLQSEARQMETQRWIKSHIAEISSDLQQASSFSDLSRTFLSRIAPLIKLGHGVFYIHEEAAKRLRLLGGYAYRERKHLDQYFSYGQGLVGQCALERSAIFIQEPPEDYVRIGSSLGEGVPHTIAVLPVMRNERLLAVLELATFETFGANEQALLDGLMPILAMSLEILERNQQTQKLLEETRRQAENMEKQAARLEEQTVEMEAQQREIKAAEEKSRLILGSVKDGIVGLDNNGVMTFANPASYTMLGYAEEEFIGQPMHALIHHTYPDGRQFPRHECRMYLTAQDGIPRTVDNEVLWCKDGTALPVEYATTPVYKNGTLVGTVIAYRDITERKRMEAEIKRTNFLADVALELTQSGYWVVDYSDPEYYFQSERAARILGEPIKPDGRYHLMNEWFSRLQEANPDTAALTAERYQGAIDGKYDKYEAVYAYKRPIDGQIVWVKAGGKLVRDESTKKILYMYGAYQDITESKLAEAEIRHINFLNDQALGLTKAGYWHVPLDGSGWYNSSKRAADIFGDIPNENYRYRVMEDWFVNVEAGDPEYAKATGQNFQEAIEGKVPAYDSIYAYKRPVDGRVVWIHAYGTIAKDENGKPTDMYGVTQDITEYMLAQQELARAKEIAEEATKTKSVFLANMSHESRTPMNAIIGMSHLALQTPLDKKQKNYIEKVHRAGENLLGIINDILDFSKIEAGKMSVEAIDFRFEDVMDHLSNLVGLKAEDKGLELLFNIAPDMPTALVGDPLRLGQILINLGNNAVKFTDKGEIIVGGEMVSQTESEAELHFWVHDSGIGMTPEQCGKMFQSFSQADATTTRKYGGTGLGLAISKNLVELMNGRIWVESEYGKGSTFHFHIKLGLQKEPMARRMFRADELLGVRVLVVDDNASAREILASMAKNFGLEVDVAWDGQNALQIITEAEKKTLPYDLVLMDWKMPGLDGVETVQRLRDEHLSKTPAVIMVTAYGREEALGNAEQRGVELKTVLTKPVTQSTLLEAIGEVLGKGELVETRAEAKSESYAESMAQLKGARVLLAEDNEMNQELAMELLGQAGMEVVVANNGQEAVDILSKDERFDGVLMDCQMPVMDGYTATREIRKMPQFEKLPIIAMTANAMSGDKEKVIEAGMVDHIAKPLNVGEMFATIAKWVKPAQSAVPPAPTFEQAPAAKLVGGLPPLPGIDIKAGMATCTNKESLYLRMLGKFRDSQGQFAELFAAAKTDPDPEATTRAAHTLKGTAGNIGAKALQAAAADLEHACKEKAPANEIEALFQKALTELTAIMPGLQQVGAGGTAPEPSKAPALPDEEMKAYFAKLKNLLEESDSEAGDLLNELLDKLGSAPLAQQLKPLAASIEGFDFDEALEKLQSLREKL